MEFLNALSSQTVIISLSDSGLLINGGEAQGEFLVYKIEDYPEFPILSKGEVVIFPQKIVEELHLILFSSSKDDARPVLTGVLFEFEENIAKLVSTDGFRLSVLSSTIVKVKNKMNFIASSRFLQEILVFYKGGDLTLTYGQDEKLFSCMIGSVSVVSRVIEGDFPPYQKVIPQKKVTTITFDTQECIKQIKAVSIFAREEGNIIVCDISQKELIFKPKGQKGKQSFTLILFRDYHRIHLPVRNRTRYRVSDRAGNTKEKGPEVLLTLQSLW